ncbi:hypothetical protein ACSBR2_015580 [Camellia fascicularis]
MKRDELTPVPIKAIEYPFSCPFQTHFNDSKATPKYQYQKAKGKGRVKRSSELVEVEVLPDKSFSAQASLPPSGDCSSLIQAANGVSQGLGRPLTVQILRGLVSTHRPTVVFLMETKNKEARLERIRRGLHFPNKCYVNPEGLSGGLALWWSDSVHLDIRFTSRNLIKGSFLNSFSHCSLSVLFVYAPPQKGLRRCFWSMFERMIHDNQYPLLCIGDFNEIGSTWEKQGGAECRMSQLQFFSHLLSECALMDLEFKGVPYTWSNNQLGADNVRERLDRAVATVEWRTLFPCAQVFHELHFGSDHCPLILNCCYPLKKIPRIFKFETMWTTSPHCEDVIRAKWDMTHLGSPMFQLVQKLKACKFSLKEWSKTAFGNNKTCISQLQSELKVLQADSASEGNLLLQNHVKSELATVMLREEMFLHQRSRV